MKKIVLLAVFALFSVSFLLQAAPADKPAEKGTEEKKAKPAAKGEFLTNYDEAMKIAKDKKLPVVMLFTGSDWCGWCIKLHDEVLKTKDFKTFAEKEAVFLYLDFPRKKELAANLKAQNKKLAQQFNISGYPSTIVLDADGQKIGNIGGYSKTYIKDLQKIINKK